MIEFGGLRYVLSFRPPRARPPEAGKFEVG